MPCFAPAWPRFTHVLAKTRCFLVGVWCFEGDFVSRGFRMKNVKMYTLAAMFLAVVGFSLNAAADPKWTIKEVMKAAQGKDALLSKVKGGKATDEEKKMLVDVYTALSQNTPKKGDKDAWEKRSKEMIKEAEEAVKGKSAFKVASDCKGCHSLHK